MRRFLGFLMLLAAPLAFGQYSRFDLSLQTAPGQAISGASVWILTQPNSCTPLGNGRSSCATLAPLAPLFTNTTGAASPVNCGVLSGTGNQIQNPGKTNQFGAFCNYISPGLYTVCYNSPYTGQICYPDQSPEGGSGGGGSGPVIQTNGVNNAFQTILNHVDTSTVKFTNPSGGVENAAVPLATSSTVGVVKPDNSTITVAGDGTLTASGSGGCTTSGGTNQPQGANGSGGCSPITTQVGGTNITTPLLPNFVGAGTVTVTNPSANEILISGASGSSSTLQMQPPAPTTGQFVYLYPQTVSAYTGPSPCVQVTNFSGNATWDMAVLGVSGFSAGCTGTQTLSGPWLDSQGRSLATLGISTGAVSNVYAFAYSSMDPGYFSDGSGAVVVSSTLQCAGASVHPSTGPAWGLTEVTLITGLSGSGIAGASCTESVTRNSSILIASTTAYEQVPAIGLAVEYTGPLAPANTAITVLSPLFFNPIQNAIGLSQLFPQQLNSLLVAQLPSSLASLGAIADVTDAATTTTCATGGGTNFQQCLATLAGWIPLPPNAGGPTSVSNTDGSLTISPTIGAVVASLNVGHTNTWSTLQIFGAHIRDTSNVAPSTTACVQVDTAGNQTNTGLPCGSGGGGGTPSAPVAGQIIAATAPGTTYAAQPGIIYGQTGDTITSIEAACTTFGGSYTYVVTQPQTLTITGNHAMNSCVTFEFDAGGLLTVNGAFTLSNVQIGPIVTPSQIFAGTSTITFAAGVTRPYVNWFGAVNYTSSSAAASGTDSKTAIQACIGALQNGQCILSTGFYRTTGVLTFARSNIGLAGQSSPWTNQSTFLTTPLPSAIVSTSASADIIDAAGTDSTHLISGNKFNDFTLLRSAVPSGTASGLALSNTFGAEVNRIWSQDSIRDFSILYSDFDGSGGFNNLTALWGYNGVLETTGSVYGFYFDGDGGGNISANLNYANTSASGSVTATSYGIFATGDVADLMVDNLETFETTYGIWVDGTSFGARNQDVHFSHSILDTCLNTCLYIDHFNGPLTFAQGWINSIGAYGARVESSFGTTISGVQFYEAGSTASVRFNASGVSQFTGNTVIPSSSSDGVDLIGSQIAITGNTIFGNGTTPATLIKLTSNSVASTIQGNVLANATTGISADNTSNGNNCFDLNTFTAITTSISDAGSGNRCSAVNLAGGALGSVPYQSAASTTTFLASPTTSGHVFAETWQPTGSAIAPTTLDLNTWNAAFNSVSTGSGATGCGSATGCVALAEAGTAGTPTAANDYFRADTSHNLLASINGAAEAPIAIRLPIGNVTFTPGSGVTSASCASSYTCTNSRGEFTLIGGTATTGTIATVNFSTTLGAAPFCTVSVNGNGGSSTTSFDLGHGLPSTSSFTVTAGVTVIGATINIDYQCQ